MATLKDVSDLSGVPMLTAFQALGQNNGVDAEIRQRVHQAAKSLGYTLKITQVDIADLADVAKGTVSYALNNSSLIKPETRQKVLDAAQALGYKLNINARNLRTNRAGVVGYSWHVADDPSRMNYLLDRFIYRLTTVAQTHHYHILTFVQPQDEADQEYEDLISSSRVDGFVISDVGYNDPRIRRLMDIGAPFAAFGGMHGENNDFAFVDVDDKYGIEIVVNHLLEQGHERVGLLTWHPGLPFADAREASYRETMKKAGIQVQEDWIAYTPNILRSSSKAAHQAMSAKNPPTALICANDLMAFGAKSYLDEMGLNMGGEVALTGYDDDPTSAFLGITSVRPPIDTIAETLFEMLFGEINQEPVAERQVVFLPELIVRQSTAP
jgi:DNA-binding LacI/PurR family transcriptional regulator